MSHYQSQFLNEPQVHRRSKDSLETGKSTVSPDFFLFARTIYKLRKSLSGKLEILNNDLPCTLVWTQVKYALNDLFGEATNIYGRSVFSRGAAMQSCLSND